MKPRLEALQVTDEDFDIYVRMAGHYRRHGYTVLQLYDAADRRDADLMLFQMKLRTSLKPRGNYIRWMDLYPDIPL